MRIPVLTAITACLLSGCRDQNPVIEVTKTRRLTYFDKDPSGNIIDLPPLGWRTIPPTEFRDMNFVAGPDDKVEIYVTNAGGRVLDNANRWLKQFGLDGVTDEGAFQTVTILGRTAVLVEAEGTYAASMRDDTKLEDYALVGALRPTNGGLLTIKMVGPKDQVAEQRPEFIKYCESMRVTDVTEIKDESEESE